MITTHTSKVLARKHVSGLFTIPTTWEGDELLCSTIVGRLALVTDHIDLPTMTGEPNDIVFALKNREKILMYCVSVITKTADHRYSIDLLDRVKRETSARAMLAIWESHTYSVAMGLHHVSG